MNKKQNLVPQQEELSTDMSKLCRDSIELIQYARKIAAKQVNIVQLMSYYSIGRWIVEEQQHGENRAQYGKKIVQNLSDTLNKEFGRGFSVDTLENARKFYLSYQERISEAVFRKFAIEKSEAVFREFEENMPFTLPWSHYLQLMRIKNKDERRFYEIEATNSAWSIRVLQRQYNSSLYERLALSRDKDEVMRLASEGLVISKPTDIVKQPTVLEFLGLEEKAAFSETDLETAIIDKLQKFLLELGKGYLFEARQKRFTFDEDNYYVDLVFYGKKIRFFIYNSAQLTEIDRFASDSSINVMIINSQAFNAKGKDARRIYMKLDEFRSRKPIDIIAKTNPILIIDEPQSVEGTQTKERLKEFCPLFTLRYSATHRADSIYNMVYRLDAMEAYNKRLVKKIAVKGITETGSTATDSYIYLEGLNLSKADPTATLQFDFKGATGIRKKSAKVGIGFNLYDNSGQLDEYKNGFVVKSIDGRDDSVEFINGIKIYAGDVIGKVSEEQLRRIQIRETILSHIQRERELFYKGIKVLSLFFIDEVANYKQYDAAGQAFNGIYADMFEEEYQDIVGNLQMQIGEDDYIKYLNMIPASSTHAGYFSVDKKGKMVNSSVAKKETTSDDIDAYDLIMKNKELLLDRNPKRSPVRFIFSHSALREGWDNPNVFQICTLKTSGSDVRKRQEVGRGLRLCVNQDGERMDVNALGNDVHNVNVLTVIASESYDSFAKGLQTEMADAVANRPKAVTPELFIGKTITDASGNTDIITDDVAREIYVDLRMEGYIDKQGTLTDKYYEDKANGEIKLTDEVAGSAESIFGIIDTIYDEKAYQPENARSNNVELQVKPDKLAMPEFKALWNRINSKSVYVVDFDTDELVRKSIQSLNSKLIVSKIYFKVETGRMDNIASKEALESGSSFVKEKSESYGVGNKISANTSVKYDLVGKLVDATGLTRKAIIQILKGIDKAVFDQFKDNPEEFIIKAGSLINDEKATAIIEHITYDVLDEKYDTDVFTAPTIKGKLGVNAIKADKHLYDHIVYDSTNEKEFAENLDICSDVAVYVKLPDGFYISTPVGHYNPDWAIAFYEGNIKHIYFVAETKGSMNSMQLRLIEESKIHCAREHFKAISNGNVVYDVVDSYQSLLDKVMK